MLLLLAALSLLAPVARAVFGVDVSTPVSASAARCMAAAPNDIVFGIARAWHSDTEGFDRSSVASLASWHAAGISADAYIFPCSFGESAASQVAQVMANLSAAGASAGRLWFDIESNPTPRCAWSANKTRNCDYMRELVAAAASAGGKWGVYSTIHMWTTLMTEASNPNGCAVASSLPLWYAHYETPPNPTFSDFAPFGGWTKPSAKQYYDGLHGPMCGVGVDNNFAPVWPLA